MVERQILRSYRFIADATPPTIPNENADVTYSPVERRPLKSRLPPANMSANIEGVLAPPLLLIRTSVLMILRAPTSCAGEFGVPVFLLKSTPRSPATKPMVSGALAFGILNLPRSRLADGAGPAFRIEATR